MAGTHEGGVKAARTVKKEKGADFHAKIGAAGGKAASHEQGAKTAKSRYGDDFHQRIGREGGKKGGRQGSNENERES